MVARERWAVKEKPRSEERLVGGILLAEEANKRQDIFVIPFKMTKVKVIPFSEEVWYNGDTFWAWWD